MSNHSTRVRMRFSRQSFSLSFVKNLVNPKGLTAFYAAQSQNSAPENSAT